MQKQPYIGCEFIKIMLQNNEQLKIMKLIYLNNSQEMFNERAFEMCSRRERENAHLV